MHPATFADALNRWGPDGSAPAAVSFAEATAYCRQLARRHYENFTVASWLLPRDVRPHFAHVYAYCRWADDLADETGDPKWSLELLDWWERELDDCYRGEARHPVFVALADTVRRFDIPAQTFRDLLIAFRQDQVQMRYETFDDLLGYCRNSANPVGRLVLYLGRCHDEQRGALADSVCTGLQLANFWQDVARDFDRGRVYLPREDCRRHGYSEKAIHAREANDAFRRLMAAQVDRAESYLRGGFPLLPLVPKWLRADVELFIRGGLAILEGIRRIDYNVWQTRPVVSKWKKARLLFACWRRGHWGRNR